MKDHALRPGPRERSRPPASVGVGETAGPWLEVREYEIRQMERERALRHLLLDVGALCATASNPTQVSRDVLLCTIIGLDAATGWVGLPAGEDGFLVCTPQGEHPDAAAIRGVIARLAVPPPGAPAIRLRPEVTAALPGQTACKVGLLAHFRGRGPNRGWIVVLASCDPGLPDDVNGLLGSIATFLGLAVSRLRTQEALTRLNRQLKARVDRQTRELRDERDSLEARVQERTAELELSRRDALDAERRLLDLERGETVQHLAAGLAHEMNNPLGAIRASLEFVDEEFEATQPGQALSPGLLEELRDAVGDSIREVDRMAGQIEDLFGVARRSRRAAVRTSLNRALEVAEAHYRRSVPGAPPLDNELEPDCWVGVSPAELARWILRILENLSATGARRLRMRTMSRSGGTRLVIDADRVERDAALNRLRAVLDEIRGTGIVASQKWIEQGLSLWLELPGALQAPVEGASA